MDKSKYRKENGNFIRRVGPMELESYALHIINKEGQMQRIINPPEDVIGILLNENADDQANPKVEFVYSIKKLARKHGKPTGKSSAKSHGKFGLHDFAQLFANSEKPAPRRGFPTINQLAAGRAEVQLPKNWKQDLNKTMDGLLDQEARRRWEELSTNLCPCKKKEILEQIRQERELIEMQRIVLQVLITGYDSYINMLLEQLERNDLVLALNLGEGKRGVWSLEKRNTRLLGTKLISGKKEFWRSSPQD
ncbi:AAEL009962-PA [Aedes aegypti]|uniref:AAEL009962-PA n=1 Tax=Aedes aegypti TaxID=7159 RepID=Q16UB3_AEDAE|nr:AAEL009962-PA [Aedes aegypti]